MLVERAVLVSGRQAALLLELCGPTITEWQNKGRPFPDELKTALEDLACLSKAVTNDTRSVRVPTPRSDPFRASIIDGVSTRRAADQLGVTPRAVVARLLRGTLRGVQQDDGTWIVDASHLALAMGGAGRDGGVAARGRPSRPGSQQQQGAA